MKELQRISAIIERPFGGGTRVTNCVTHMGLPLTQRPRGCDLCRTDLENRFALAISANEFMNGQLDEIRDVIANAAESEMVR